MQRFDVAVVGGGASGTFFVSEALRKSTGWTMLWVAPPDSPGVAYSSTLHSHLLNVPAERMGAFVDRPGDFHDWLKSSPEFTAYGPHDFVPRRVFGDYLRDLARTARQSQGVEARASRVSSVAAVAGDDGPWWRLGFDDGTWACARRLVLATGTPGHARSEGAGDRFVADPWNWLRSLPGDWSPPGPQQDVVIIGSGLTAIDTVVALRDLGFRGHIRVYSRSGRWSEAHESVAPLGGSLRDAITAELLSSPTCRSYLRVLRRHSGYWPWRAVIDGLRPVSQQLWEALPLVERRRFLRHLFSAWNRHRHRAPPVAARRIGDDARLTIGKRRTSADDIARWIAAGDAALIIDCRGAGLASRTPWPVFLQALKSAGLLAESPLGVG